MFCDRVVALLRGIRTWAAIEWFVCFRRVDVFVEGVACVVCCYVCVFVCCVFVCVWLCNSLCGVDFRVSVSSSG